MPTETSLNSAVAPGSATVAAPLPSQGSEAWREIAIYNDGSGKAGSYYDSAIKTIEKWEAVHRVQRAFIAKHIETLAGLYWRVAYLEAAIEISYGLYRGKRTTPTDIALLWPEARWKRAKEKYTSEIRYNWEAVVDGITLRIENAESEEPRPKLRDGATIILPRIRPE